MLRTPVYSGDPTPVQPTETGVSYDPLNTFCYPPTERWVMALSRKYSEIKLSSRSLPHSFSIGGKGGTREAAQRPDQSIRTCVKGNQPRPRVPGTKGGHWLRAAQVEHSAGALPSGEFEDRDAEGRKALGGCY